jgi:molybdopterin adenylyltransferase
VLIVNLPGSPKGAVESLDAVAGLIPHVVDLLHGRTEHSA